MSDHHMYVDASGGVPDISVECSRGPERRSPVVVEISGPWGIVARLARGGEPGDGTVTIQRHNTLLYRVPAYRFPAGWRCRAVGTLPIAEAAKRAARRAVRKLP